MSYKARILEVLMVVFFLWVTAATADVDNDLMEAAARYDSLRVINSISNGADVNAKFNDVGTALIITSMHGHKYVVQMLLDKGANVNVKGYNSLTALIVASETGRKDIVHMLLSKVADVNTTMNNDRIALSLAFNQEIKELLIKAGAK